MSKDNTDRSGQVAEDFDRLDDGACFEIDVTGHKLYVRREEGQLIGVRHKPGDVVVPPHEKDAEFVRRMMAWKGYREVPWNEAPFDHVTEGEVIEDGADQQQKLVTATDGGNTRSVDTGTEQ